LDAAGAGLAVPSASSARTVSLTIIAFGSSVASSTISPRLKVRRSRSATWKPLLLRPVT
jgi:hypothetical protein